MAIIQTISGLPSPPNPATDDATTFAAKASAFTTALVLFGTQMTQFGVEVNNTQAQMNAAQTGSAVGIGYTFSTLTTASDPGSGSLRLNNATQNASTAVYASNVSSDTTDWGAVIAQFTGSSSTVKGFLKLHKASDGTKWIVCTLTAVASPTGYKNITLSVIGSSSASPFVNGDSLVMTFTRNGDAASGGGAAISDIISQTQNSGTTAGTSTAYTLTPATAATSYSANQLYFVTFHAASGDSPTFTISGVATPPNLVKLMADGTYANIRQGDIPTSLRSRVVGVSATQYAVLDLPTPAGATDYNVIDFSADITIGFQHRGAYLRHPSADNVTARTVTIPANASVPLPMGTAITIRNKVGASSVNIAITTDTMYLAGGSGTGPRTLAAGGIATIIKDASNEWVISGSGLT